MGTVSLVRLAFGQTGDGVALTFPRVDKKNAQQREGQAHLDGESVVHSSHGPAAQKREFRRKSG